MQYNFTKHDLHFTFVLILLRLFQLPPNFSTAGVGFQNEKWWRGQRGTLKGILSISYKSELFLTHCDI